MCCVKGGCEGPQGLHPVPDGRPQRSRESGGAAIGPLQGKGDISFLFVCLLPLRTLIRESFA